MAKLRKTAARTRRPAKGTRRTKLGTGSKARKKKVVARKTKRRKKSPGIMTKVTNAVTMVAETSQESSELARRIGPRGGLSEG